MNANFKSQRLISIPNPIYYYQLYTVVDVLHPFMCSAETYWRRIKLPLDVGRVLHNTSKQNPSF